MSLWSINKDDKYWLHNWGHNGVVNENSYKYSRFSGITMNTGYENQVVIMRIVYTRPEEKIDRITLTLNSKSCEQCFCILKKYTQGKKLILGKIDSWQVS